MRIGCLARALVVWFVAFPLVLDSAFADVSGTWIGTWRWKDAAGIYPFDMKLEQNGNALSGTAFSGAALVTGTVSGSAVTVEVLNFDVNYGRSDVYGVCTADTVDGLMTGDCSDRYVTSGPRAWGFVATGASVPKPTVKLIVLVNGVEATPGASVVKIPPSVLPPAPGSKCSATALAYDPKVASITLKCVNVTSGLPVEGCTYSLQLSGGTFNGGHAHGSRPLVCKPSECYDVPNLLVSGQSGTVDAIGTLINYAAPEIAGGVNLAFAGKDPNGKAIAPSELPPAISFHVQEPGSETADGLFAWQPLSNDYLDVIVNGVDPGASHAIGYYGVPELANRLSRAGAAFFAEVSTYQTPPRLQSEAGSLPWGGLYDVGRDWKSPHCGHRDGRTIDLSMSAVPSNELKTSLRESLRKQKFKFFEPESPANSNATHWHAYIP